MGGKPGGKKPLTEDDWSVFNEKTIPYEKSKTIAERAAWDFMDQLPGLLS